MTSPKVLLMDEPSRGIDVGAKADVFRTMRELARDGLGILFVTSDLDEVMALSDRIVVMSNGKLTGMFDRGEATEAAIVAASALGHGRPRDSGAYDTMTASTAKPCRRCASGGDAAAAAADEAADLHRAVRRHRLLLGRRAELPVDGQHA